LNQKDTFKKIDIFSEDKGIIISSHNIHTEGDRITLFGEDFELISHQTIVEVIGYFEDGVILMHGLITLSTSSQLNITIVSTDKKRERRNYLKVKTKQKINILRAFAMGNSNKSMIVHETVLTRDLSLGGICFFSNRTFFINQKLLFDFNFLKARFIAEGLVLRKERQNYRTDYRYKYACKFINLNSEHQRVLCEYVYKIQIDAHKRMKALQEDLNL